jgi:fructuronate reductase
MRLAPGLPIPPGVTRPLYDRTEHAVGIVHLGIGAFHRAHQGAYTDTALGAGDRDFLITGVSLRSPKVAEALNPQSGLYTLTQRSGGARSMRLIGAVQGVLFAPGAHEAVLSALAGPKVAVVSLTVTEKAYRPPQGAAYPEFCAVIARGLARRQAAGLSGVTLMSCDNLSGNGAVLRSLVSAAVAGEAPQSAAWMEAECAFPSTMVDRIVPAVSAQDLDEVALELGLRDEGAVITEPFSQWVIEDRFAARRPRWEAGGAQIVRHVRPYETAKLRMLNGAHSALAYLGLERGHVFVHEAMGDAALAPVIEGLMRQEAASSFTPSPEQDLSAYADALLRRFGNAALRHRLAQIAMDGSQKIPQRWLETLAAHQARGEACPAILSALAAWVRHVRGEAGPIEDPMAASLAETWRRAGPQGIAAALFGEGGLFAQAWTASPETLARLTALVRAGPASA